MNNFLIEYRCVIKRSLDYVTNYTLTFDIKTKLLLHKLQNFAHSSFTSPKFNVSSDGCSVVRNGRCHIMDPVQWRRHGTFASSAVREPVRLRCVSMLFSVHRIYRKCCHFRFAVRRCIAGGGRCRDLLVFLRQWQSDNIARWLAIHFRRH